MANTVNKVLNVAKGEVGYLEKKSNKYLNDKTKMQVATTTLSTEHTLVLTDQMLTGVTCSRIGVWCRHTAGM